MSETTHDHSSDASQDPAQRKGGPAVTFPHPVVPDEQDIVTVAPPTGKHLEENPAATDLPQ